MTKKVDPILIPVAPTHGAHSRQRPSLKVIEEALDDIETIASTLRQQMGPANSDRVAELVTTIRYALKI